MQKICRHMWYDYITKYDKVYMACSNGIHYYLDQNGTFLTKTYRNPSPGNSKPLMWYEEAYPSKIINEDEGIDYTCNVEFTTHGLIYGIAENRWIMKPELARDMHILFEYDTPQMQSGKHFVDIKFQYFFVPYENE